MFSKFCASKHETDVEKSTCLGSGSGCAGRHDSVWRRGESIVSESMESVESKTEMCTEQSGYLWKSRRHFFWENSRQKNCRSWQEKLRSLIFEPCCKRVAEVYVSRFDHAEKERGNFEFSSDRTGRLFAGGGKRWHENIFKWKNWMRQRKDTFAAEKFGKISGEFPGNGWPLNLRWQSLCNGVIMDADYEKNVIKERI